LKMTEPVFYPLTFPQQSIWDIERFYGNISYTNIATTVVIREKINMDLLEEAINIILLQHEALRLRLVENEGEPRQYISQFSKNQFDRLDFSHPTQLKDYEEWQNYLTKIPFQGLNADLFYIALVRLGKAEGAMYLKFHHIISDAWTLTMIIREILNTYKDLISHVPLSIVQKPSYLDYIIEDMEYQNSPKYKERKAFWLQEYETIPEFTFLKERTQRRDIRAKRKTVMLSTELSEEIKRFSSEYKVSGFVIFFAILALYISKTTLKHDLVIGTPVLNRANHLQKNTVGMFISNIPFRININTSWDFLTYLYRISEKWKKLLRNQRYPYQEILKSFRETHCQVGALTDVFFSYQNAKHVITDIDYESFWHFNGQEINTLSLHVSDWKDNGTLRMDYDYLIEALTETKVEQIHHYLIILLKDAFSAPSKTLSELSLLTNQEKYRLLNDLNLTDVDFPLDATIQQLFEAQVEKTPEHVALIVNDQRLTYRALNERANQLANTLRKRGVRSDSIVGIMVNRSFELMIGILGVLKAGGAYLPIDPKYPIAWIEDVLCDSKTHILLTHNTLNTEREVNSRLAQTLGLEQINLEDPTVYIGTASNLASNNKSCDLAYVIYTSGSTGKPKGVMIEHRSVNNLIHALYRELHFLEQKAIVSLTTVSFDIFVMETLLPLSQGLCVVMANEEERQIPKLLFHLINKYNIKMLQATPSKMRSILKDPQCSDGLALLSEIFIGGETLSEGVLKHVQKVAPSARIYNMYGPTETTVWSIYKDVTLADYVTIGNPIANTRIYILDEERAPVPIGITGEIYIGGEGLARGYLNREDLTKEKFVTDLFHQDQTMYKTGDLGRWTSKDEIEHLGRNDDQVKIRGFRIELREVEHCLLEHKLIQEAVVISREDGKDKNYLCAYLVGDPTCTVSDLRAYLVRNLPDYMIPSRFVWLDVLPLTPNSKINKKALPEPGSTGMVQNNEPFFPRDELEEELALIWTKALDLEHVSLDDNFFALGGDSLAIIEVLSGLWFREWGLSAQDFYDYPTIRQLSEKVRGKLSRSKESDLLSENFPSIDLEYDKTPPTPMSVPMGNVLLTGATGFLGTHLIGELLKSTTCKIYCLMRGQESETRLKSLLKFYFSESLQEIDHSRIQGINGDISLEKFGLSAKDYEELGRKVDTVIHAAGLVKHYGSYSEFEKVNVGGTQEIIAFCLAFGKPMNHVSTMSVSGNRLVQAPGKGRFSETDLYIGQNYLDNLYIRSKFEAEAQVLKAKTLGVKATIFRIGLLTGRYTDGHFQANIHENAFYQKLKSIMELQAIQRNHLLQELEFTPVDVSAKGIISIIRSNTQAGRVFHMCNHKTIKIEEMINILYSLGKKIDWVDKALFYQLVDQKQKRHKNSLYGFVLDLTEELPSDLTMSIEIESNITQGYLAQIGFEWPEITAEYLSKIIEYMKKVGFLR